MRERLAKLIDMKSIVTISLTYTLIIVMLTQLQVDKDVFALFNNSFMLCLGFFFGKRDSIENK